MVVQRTHLTYLYSEITIVITLYMIVTYINLKLISICAKLSWPHRVLILSPILYPHSIKVLLYTLALYILSSA